MGRLHSLVPSADVVQNLRDTAVLDQYERGVGGGSGAGVVGQNAKTSADREVLLREGGILRKGENAVFLIGARQDNRAVGQGLRHLVPSLLRMSRTDDGALSSESPNLLPVYWLRSRGRLIRALSLLIRDDAGEVVGVLCINQDVPMCLLPRGSFRRF